MDSLERTPISHLHKYMQMQSVLTSPNVTSRIHPADVTRPRVWRTLQAKFTRVFALRRAKSVKFARFFEISRAKRCWRPLQMQQRHLPSQHAKRHVFGPRTTHKFPAFNNSRGNTSREKPKSYRSSQSPNVLRKIHTTRTIEL